MRHSDSSPSIPPRFVAFARRYHPSTCGFAPSDAKCCVHGLGLGEPVPAPPAVFTMETTRPPGFPGNPPARMPRAPTPARSPPPRPLRCGEIAFRPTHDVGPHKQCISGLNHAAYGLPVNASRPGSPQAHASLGSGWRPTLAGWDWIPTGFRTRFQRSHHGILSPLTGLSRHTRCCTNRNWLARWQPTGSLPADARRRWSAEGSVTLVATLAAYLGQGGAPATARSFAAPSTWLTEIDQSGSRSVFRQCDSLSSTWRIARGKVTAIFAKSSFTCHGFWWPFPTGPGRRRAIRPGPGRRRSRLPAGVNPYR